ncbi:MAG TPA: fused MFS/spermidine synthase [Vicinamibacteria bacterium]|nr:fused MFS/spermidine synthase [Vicinamibacteria bacterium]
MTTLFAGVVGLGSLLLFQVQLVLGKQLLPWFGGASAVWTTCLLFFQAALLAGYAWAHLLADRLSPRRQRDAHLVLLGAALALLLWRAFAWPSPITLGEWAKAGPPDGPIAAILALLASTIGLPFVVLAATSPLLQAWFARLRPGQSPFWLFALSNGGSLLGLLSYPLLVEPFLSVKMQGWLWSVAFAVYAGGVAWCGVATPRGSIRVGRRGGRNPGGFLGTRPTEVPRSDKLLWLALAFFPSVMLGAVTSHLTQEVAAVPFLWMVPLALYLVSFIVCFSWPDAGRAGWRVALAVAAGLAVFGLHGELMMKVPPRVVLWCGVLFVYAMAGHGELARRRPEPSGLTGYYLAIAAGGALGGLLNAVVAPLLFTGYWELHLGILAGPLVVLVASAIADSSSPDTDEAPRGDRAASRQVRIAAVLAIVALGAALLWDAVRQERGLLLASRGFYGVLRVVREEPGEPDEYVKLLHGQITHGLQLSAPARRAELTAYYGPSSGAGLAIRRHAKRLAGRPMRVGVIGLGVGTLAAWSRPGDVFRFYEIDPEVVRLSEGSHPVFSYRRDGRGDVSVRLGDGRLVLESEAPQAFDVLVVDAFSSDSIPVHLLTREAFGVYLRHLAPGGVLAVHVTNRYLDLKPVVRGAAAELGLNAEHVPSFEQSLLWSSDWMLLTRDRALLEDELVRAATLPRLPGASTVVWRDDWSDLLGALKR